MVQIKSITFATVAISATLMASSQAKSDLKSQLINQHNIIRKAHGLGEITWDDQLSTKMQAYADSCPGFKHGGPSGFQNLASYENCSGDECNKKLGGTWMWYDEEETKWNYGSHQCTGSWIDCGHFSNMMGPGVKSIGCGWSECGGAYGGRYVWCNYNGAEKYPNVPQRTMSKEDLKKSLTSGGASTPSPSSGSPATKPTTTSPVTNTPPAYTPASTTTPPTTAYPTKPSTKSPVTSSPSAYTPTSTSISPVPTPSNSPSIRPEDTQTKYPTAQPASSSPPTIPSPNRCDGGGY